MTCPYHLSLSSLIFPNRSTLTVLLMYSFLILSFLVTPIANLNIFIFATSISSTCSFLTATVSRPYTVARLTIELYTFPFTLAGNLLSHCDTIFHPFHPSFTLFFVSFSQLPLPCTVDRKYFLHSWHFCILHLYCFFVIFSIYAQIFCLLTYLLSSLFFPTHISSILVSTPFLL